MTFTPNGTAGADGTSFSADTVGTYTVKVQYTKDGSTAQDSSGNIVVVQVDNIQFRIENSTFYYFPPEGICVAKGTTLYFRAISDPAGQNWPDGKPVWSGTAGVTGTGDGIGDVKSARFSTVPPEPATFYTVVASCGNDITGNVYVTDLSAADIDCKRTTAPSEATAYEVRSTEHLELWGTFAFNLDTGDWRVPFNLGWEMWETSCMHTVVDTGSGSSFSEYMSSNLGLQDDGGFVRFYADNNNTGDSEAGGIDPRKDTPEFTVQELETHALVFAKSNSVGAINAAGACADATALILARDESDDYRARAEVTQSGNVTTINGADPVCLELDGDSILDTWGEWAAYVEHQSAPDVVVVNDIQESDANKVQIQGATLTGVGAIGTKYKIILDSTYLCGGTLAHELGHNCGLEHTPYTGAYINHVMYKSTVGTETRLDLGERDNFE